MTVLSGRKKKKKEEVGDICMICKRHIRNTGMHTYLLAELLFFYWLPLDPALPVNSRCDLGMRQFQCVLFYPHQFALEEKKKREQRE